MRRQKLGVKRKKTWFYRKLLQLIRFGNIEVSVFTSSPSLRRDTLTSGDVGRHGITTAPYSFCVRNTKVSLTARSFSLSEKRMKTMMVEVLWYRVTQSPFLMPQVFNLNCN